uniref:Peptidase aspartic putative domain-containing protein n=1 Tax=Anopheles stephensi TaxID=30069 RepID=A0A182YI92_ANOST
MKRRQEAERKRVELELQLKFVKEEEDLLAEELGIKDNPETSTLLPSHAADNMVQHSQRKEREQIQREGAHRGTPTELPVFAGDPADWPLFITFYEHTTEKCGLSNWENMLRLQKALKGPALEAVRSRLLLPEVVPQVIATLRSRYGRSTHLISALIDKVHRTPAPCLEKPETVVAFGEAVQSMVDHMKAAGRQAHLTNPLLLKEIVEKLPISEQYNWTRFVSHIEEPDLLMFREYMAELQSTAEVLSSRESPSGHEVDKCFVFGAMAVKERWMKARALSLCFGCLGKHNWRTCHNRPHALSSSNTLFRIVPITVYGPTSTVTTFAFLDEGSSMTLVDEDLAEELGVEGEVEPLCIRWTGDTTRVEAGSRRVNFKVGPVGSAKSFAINSVRTVPKLNLPRQSFVPDEGRWKHLKRLPVREYHDAEPKVLIGLDNLRLMVPLRTIEGAAGDPIAVKTRLGWCIYGKPMKVECERLLHICECNNQAEILETMRKFYDLEQVGVVRVVELDPDVRRAQHLLETTTVRIGKRFESGLLWKADDIQLPSSIGMASRRFDCLEKRMERDGQLKLQSDGGTIKCLSSTGDDTERVLGMRWNPASDELGFCTRACTAVSGVLTAERIPTKREVLRCVMSLYDPLGLLAMFVIHGKILIQDLWRTGTQWDEEISSNQYRDWRRWVDLFQTIADIRIPRCYFTEACMKTYENSEWHLFVDASQHAYACVLYLRIVDDTGEAQCTLVGGKAKVAPLKPLTIPKLELQACVLGARFLLYTQEHHPIKAKRRVLWSDSTVALSWIRADPRNYKPFVAHRSGRAFGEHLGE